MVNDSWLICKSLFTKKSSRMKKLILLTLCIMGLVSCSQKRPSMIERPIFEVWNSSILEIDKIEMSDSATVFHIDAYYQPNKWISINRKTYIRKSGSDEKLLITYSEGINLDEETIMPESGTMSFKLYFPPLKPGITKIDFIESDCPDCFKIWGIHLLPNAKIKFDPVPKDAAKTSADPLPTPEYSTQPAQVSGKMFGYIKGMQPDFVTITAFNPLYMKKNEAIFPIAENGSFNGEITPGFAGIYTSSEGPLFLIPGKEAKIYVDLKKRSRYQSRYRTDKEPGDSIYTYISGGFTYAELEAINQVAGSVIKALPDLTNYQKLMEETVHMKPEEFKQYMLSVMNTRLDEINQKGYSSNMQIMIENAIKIEVYLFMMQYEGFILSAYRRVNNITTVEDMEKVRSSIEKPDAEYYSFLKGELNDNISYLPYFLVMVEYLNDVSSFFQLSGGRKNNPAKERFDSFKEKWELVLGEEKGMLYDMIQSLHYGWKLFDMECFTDAEKQEIRDVFRDKPVYSESLIAESDRVEAIIKAISENNESIVNELPDVPQEQMLDAILANYKGKVVVIDFWGTWCGPCIAAMKTIQPLKDELKGKDVVWVYMADETSPINDWKQTIPTISGEHYRVSNSQRIYWEQYVYPTYKLFDRQGKPMAKHVDFPGIEVMKREIEKGL